MKIYEYLIRIEIKKGGKLFYNFIEIYFYKRSHLKREG